MERPDNQRECDLNGLDARLFRRAQRREEAPVFPVEVEKAPVPKFSALFLFIIVTACALSLLFPSPGAELSAYLQPPGPSHPFGTDALGRDLLLMVLQGGARSLLIGLLAAAEALILALAYGCAAALSPRWLDEALLRFLDALTSVPSILPLLFITAIFGRMRAVSIALSIGACTWMGLARIIRTQIIRMRESEYFLASKMMGAGFFDLLVRHALPLVFSECLFMIVMNVRSAIVDESTLSFMGLGLPVEAATWGSLLSMSQDALLTGAWWLILIPGAFLSISLVCLTSLSQWVRERIS